MATNLAIAAFLLATTLFSSSSSAARETILTIHNLCPYPVWPLFTPDSGFPALCDRVVRLVPNGVISVRFPDTPWSGRVTTRTGCDGTGRPRLHCATGSAPPSTVAQLMVHYGGVEDRAVYSVSLVDGFNVPMVITPQGGGGTGHWLCTPMGCAVDLNRDCPPDQRASGGAACRGPRGYFKALCPEARTTPGDRDPVPQSCRAPEELKIVLCQPTPTQP
ncbi:osmotin-like protein [Brachypodium distachyon]|uniref:Osmotin-like protein n=1 Tax=Brachypodium distachyon TaxID=15368 RepID=I1IHC3_BRADI|nr:osmotin-like protein [Brachypodium distachyon]KQJ86237.1 hypothetical protein BRADI_4g04150v3 [Brachypodium distachyon]|eukprot:XP_003579279.1 osmotin-like protein [Brachypodium distachyon]